MQQGNLVIRYMRLRKVRQSESVRVGEIVDFGESEGLSSAEIEDALVYAGFMGWIVAIDLDIHLTRHGFMMTYPANDNS